MSNDNTRIILTDSITQIDATQWDALDHQDNPFLRHALLAAFESGDCLKPWGWQPHIIALYQDDQLVGAVPSYLKDNSFGEFIFDWSWAEAYQQHGLDYYPKLVAAAPFTPATGPRLLVHPEQDFETIGELLINALRQHCINNQFSGVHLLFCTQREANLAKKQGFALRDHYQFHWHNQGYTKSTDFTDALMARKRKKVKRERSKVKEQGLSHQTYNGHSMTPFLWHHAYRLYASIYDRKWGAPALSLDFFQSIGKEMPDNINVVFAFIENQDAPVACAILIQGGNKLYGRYWGCDEHWHSLHFETCYYQGIDLCIENKIEVFEPGAQGEHKIARGFIPTATYSAHWLAEPSFHDAVSRYCKQESPFIEQQMTELMGQTPYANQRTPNDQ